MSRIDIIGAGAFGTGLAIALGRAGNHVTLWARSAEHADAMARARENQARLPGCALPASVDVTFSLSDLQAEIALLALPTQSLGPFLRAHADDLKFTTAVACCKGVDVATGRGPTGLIASILPGVTPAVLTGPSFAADIARGLPTALTLACSDEEAGRACQSLLWTDRLRLYRTTDVVGAELGGALKNVVAIACGLAIGAGLGESARAALMTRGFAEMQRFAVHRGARPETLSGLSGFGDLALTCTSEQSRNFRFGLTLARGQSVNPTETVEGVATAAAVASIAREAGLDMPITAMVDAVVGRAVTVQEAMDDLLSRPLKQE